MGSEKKKTPQYGASFPCSKISHWGGGTALASAAENMLSILDKKITRKGNFDII